MNVEKILFLRYRDLILLSIIFVCIYIAYPFCSDDVASSEVLLTVVWFIGLIYSFSGDRFNILQILLAMFFVFNLSIPILSSFGIYQYPMGNLVAAHNHVYVVIPDHILARSYWYTLFFLSGLILGFSAIKKSSRSGLEYLSNSVIKGSSYSLLFYVTFFLVLSHAITLLFNASSVGYVDAIHLRSTDGFLERIFIIASAFFPYIFALMLVGEREKPQFIKYAVLFILPFLLIAIIGQRGPLMINLTVIFLLYNYRFGPPRYSLVFPFLLILYIAFSYIEVGRFEGYQELGFVDFLVSMRDSIVYQITFYASSMSILPYVIIFEDEFFNSVPFAFGYFDAIFSFTPNYTIEALYDKSYLAQHITYFLDENRLLNGSTVGTSMVAELYDLFGKNLILYVVSGYVLMTAYNKLMVLGQRSPFWLYIFMIFAGNLVLMPRGSVFKMFSKNSLLVVCVIVIFIAIWSIARHGVTKERSMKK